MNATRLLLLGVLLLFGLGCAASVRPYAVDAPLAIRQLDLDAWDRLLRAHVRDGQVDYPAFCDSEPFARVLDEMARVSLDGASRDERLSFLINAYNARSIRSILDGERPSTLLGRYGFFLRGRHPVAGQEITLFDLERDAIMGFADPRSHFVIVCSSASCPKLASTAYRARGLDAQLDAAVRRFVNDPSRNRFDVVEGVAGLSSIFDWYRDEFEESAGTLERYVAHYVADAEVASALREGELKVGFLDYDWSLNGTPPGEGGACPDR